MKKKRRKPKRRKQKPSVEAPKRVLIFSTGGRRYIGSPTDSIGPDKLWIFTDVFEIISVTAMVLRGVSTQILVEYPDLRELAKKPIPEMLVHRLDWAYAPEPAEQKRLRRLLQKKLDEDAKKSG